jgi:uncharacterized protein (DUF2141 family)
MKRQNDTFPRVLWQWLPVCIAVLLAASCARMGSPDGGWYDETPPRVVSSTPQDKGVNVKAKKITINFNEYIKIEDAQNKVIVSPPQLEQAEIKGAGKRIIVELKDTLKEETTYTVDFSDAISDNNEGNPMGNYTFSFSTGDHIDTLEVSGYCLNAEDLEPVKGILVGLYPYDAPDSIFRHEPMIRVSRTNASGKFTIKGVATGAYRVYALQDADGDYVFGQKSEMIGFSTERIEPSWKPDTRPDTLWRDSLHISDIKFVGFTHFLPDDVTLLCFQEPQTTRALLKTERSEPNKIGIYFTYGNDTLPKLRGLNFDSTDAFVLEASEKNDTLTYWIADTTLVNQDTLCIEMTYLRTDTLDQLVESVDTIEFLPKVGYAKRLKDQQKEESEWQKEQEKKKKRGEAYDSIMPVKPLEIRVSASSQMTPDDHLILQVPEPLAVCDTSAIHLYQQIDSMWYNCPHEVRQLSVRSYEVVAQWKPGMELSLEIDSAAFQSIYGKVSAAKKDGIKMKKEEEFSTLTIEMKGLPEEYRSNSVVVMLMDANDKVTKQVKADDEGVVTFHYLSAGKFYIRAFIDLNDNGQWDTGCYDEGLQAEPVYYHPEAIECKEKWDVSRQWNLTATPRFKQKPEAILKQKPEAEKKKKRSMNLDRAKKLGKEYLKDKGVNL